MHGLRDRGGRCLGVPDGEVAGHEVAVRRRSRMLRLLGGAALLPPAGSGCGTGSRSAGATGDGSSPVDAAVGRRAAPSGPGTGIDVEQRRRCTGAPGCV